MRGSVGGVSVTSGSGLFYSLHIPYKGIYTPLYGMYRNSATRHPRRFYSPQEGGYKNAAW